jgi:glycosyltransferase involved in cell wall biosynthesis
MRVAIVHYHLHLGGVTRVIQNAVVALERQGVQAAVLTGELPEHSIEGLEKVQAVPGLGYEGVRAPWTSRELATGLLEAARSELGAPPDLWHIHNHSLGKNLALPEAVRHLAEDGHHLFLQIHDFAEDGRPENYRQLLARVGEGDPARLAGRLYPQAANVHYAVLNGRDRGFLASAGIARPRLHLMPNAVWVEAGGEPAPTPYPNAPPLWLYPTRAIRRKNLGEFLLLAALAPSGHRFATTLAPKNPLERPRYEGWLAFATELELPVELGVTDRAPERFDELVRSAHALVTTSIAEGFGLAFLEPWLMGRAVVGRDLPELSAEFREAGINLDALYRRLEVPLAWLDQGALRDRIGTGLRRYLGAYGREPAADARERVWGAWVKKDRVDFGRLDEELQREVIRRVAGAPGSHREVRPGGLPSQVGSPELITRNRQAILESFGLDAYGERLLGLYRRLAAASPEAPVGLSADALLDQFLAPERLYLLRT